MNDLQLLDSYARRALDYIGLFGSIRAVHPDDLALVSHWARELRGPVLDAGCGPGHWAGHLHAMGVEVSGLDLVPEFIEHAQHTFPDVPFTVGSLASTGRPDASLAGILAWYSLIHLSPGELPAVLAEFRRLLAPGGSMLLGFFDADAVEPFDHKVATAYRWPVDSMAAQLAEAGFEEARRATRPGDGNRPHAVIIAKLAGARLS
ncbi:SAM-dependent methyltransferase [Arthrobacter silviterrae]|uniref:Class I SAM-dependent methyltransferase n=1 Tax=Arthrobacter silviterrae TaxID=2026658 RepID=A0ABX0DE21_9MICC|nr:MULTISPECIES: class I SAM-dependent methyltransferase [Arthrobacter]MCU6480237.1 class I SAM-dependent methyltransferase [Arthrobacter sp. A2-55]MDQ0276221.1 SAM-dependent methyltransferase [Arthrobacter silviterrae]NGN82685.1 class I SAM-dependent methyltransferase [Arthrobacter silviterrae]